jgi:hypothetical protein
VEFDFSFRHGWERELENQADDLLVEAGEKVRDGARANAGSISRDTDAIVSTEVENDSEGPYVDVGYDKNNPGFVLWWHEVGTSKFPPHPHLRPAAARKVV